MRQLQPAAAHAGVVAGRKHRVARRRLVDQSDAQVGVGPVGSDDQRRMDLTNQRCISGQRGGGDAQQLRLLGPLVVRSVDPEVIVVRRLTAGHAAPQEPPPAGSARGRIGSHHGGGGAGFAEADRPRLRLRFAG